MKTGEILRNSWKYLPVVSLIRFRDKYEKKPSVFNCIRLMGHFAYGMGPILATIGLLAYGNPNPFEWDNEEEKRIEMRDKIIPSQSESSNLEKTLIKS